MTSVSSRLSNPPFNTYIRITMNKTSKALATICLGFVGLSAYCQSTGSLLKSPELLLKESSSTASVLNESLPANLEEEGLSLHSYFSLLGGNLRQAFTKPFHMNKKDWRNAGAVTAFAIALSFEDESVQQLALKFNNQHPGLRKASNCITNFGGTYELYALSALGSYGFLFKKEKMKTTTLLATQAYITGAAVESVLKFLTVRMRPSFYDPATEAEPTFKGPFYAHTDYVGSRSHSSFPSGHTTSAFAVATVFATMYKDRPWIPAVSYSAATLVGLSRITENRHWATDVAVGAALGFLAGRQAVSNYHHYQAGQTKSGIARFRFNLQYQYGHLQPGVICKL